MARWLSSGVILGGMLLGGASGCTTGQSFELIMYPDVACFAAGALDASCGSVGVRSVALEPDGGTATYTSPVVTPARPFDSVILSWNVDVPVGASFVVHLRVQTTAGEWSPWLHAGDWGADVPPLDERVVACAMGEVAVDVFEAATPCAALQYRVQATASKPVVVHLRRMAISLRLAEARDVDSDGDRTKTRPVAETVRLDVPFHNQVTPKAHRFGYICSPTSVAMVLAYWGVDTSVDAVADLCYDDAHQIYGGWPRAVQAAYTLGIRGYVTRISDWSEVAEHLAAGQPLIVSMQVRRDYPELPYGAVGGHLVVVTGLDADGVYLNDSALRKPADGQYRIARHVLERVWLQENAVAYVLDGSVPRDVGE